LHLCKTLDITLEAGERLLIVEPLFGIERRPHRLTRRASRACYTLGVTAPEERGLAITCAQRRPDGYRENGRDAAVYD
jgi:hypothetical protein